MSVLSRLKKFVDKDYRDGYLRSQIGAGIAYQIQALRAKLGLTQTQFADLVGSKQTVISRLENSGSGMVNVQTLLKIAEGADVALLVQFVSYPEFLTRTADMTERALQPDTIYESLAAPTPRQPEHESQLAGLLMRRSRSQDDAPPALLIERGLKAAGPHPGLNERPLKRPPKSTPEPKPVIAATFGPIRRPPGSLLKDKK